jgi:hypothetical protein
VPFPSNLSAEAYGASYQGTFDFFLTELSDTPSVTRWRLMDRQQENPEELPYCASILAHFASTSTEGGDESYEGPITPRTIVNVLDNYILKPELCADAEIMESAGAQSLLLTGFFYQQSRSDRGNLAIYVKQGVYFFARAASGIPHSPKKQLLETVSTRFGMWQRAFHEASQACRGRSYLLPHS